LNAVIGDILPLALGVAISPIPIIAAILMLFSPRATGTSVGFLVGWGYAFVEPLVAPLLFLIFGNLVAGTLNQEFGWSYDTWWVVSAVAAAVVVLGWFGSG